MLPAGGLPLGQFSPSNLKFVGTDRTTDGFSTAINVYDGGFDADQIRFGYINIYNNAAVVMKNRTIRFVWNNITTPAMSSVDSGILALQSNVIEYVGTFRSAFNINSGKADLSGNKYTAIDTVEMYTFFESFSAATIASYEDQWLGNWVITQSKLNINAGGIIACNKINNIPLDTANHPNATPIANVNIPGYASIAGIPQAYGTIKANGDFAGTKGLKNVTKTGTGLYEVTPSQLVYSALVSATGSADARATWWFSGNLLYIKMFDAAGQPVDRNVSFILF